MASKQNPFAAYYYNSGGSPPRTTTTAKKNKEKQMPASSPPNPNPRPAARPRPTTTSPVAEKKTCPSMQTQSPFPAGVSPLDFLKSFAYTGPSPREIMAQQAAANPPRNPNPPPAAPPLYTVGSRREFMARQAATNRPPHPNPPPAARARPTRTSPVAEKKTCPSMQTQAPFPAGVSPLDFLKSFTYTGPSPREILSQPAAANPPRNPHPPPAAPLLSTMAKIKRALVKRKQPESQVKRQRCKKRKQPESRVKRQRCKKRKQPESQVKRQRRKRRKSPLLTAAEKRSDKYLRVPDNCLVEPPRSPYNLLQEQHASDPWKVIVTCMLLNVTTGKQVGKVLDEFFDLCPDAKTAAKTRFWEIGRVIKSLGLQWTRAIKIVRLSRCYLYTNWTYVTELPGVGKYAADAYAIFCAGKAREVVPMDHKLVDYWKFVCGLPETNGSIITEVSLLDTAEGNNNATRSSDIAEGNNVAEVLFDRAGYTVEKECFIKAEDNTLAEGSFEEQWW